MATPTYRSTGLQKWGLGIAGNRGGRVQIQIPGRGPPFGSGSGLLSGAALDKMDRPEQPGLPASAAVKDAVDIWCQRMWSPQRTQALERRRGQDRREVLPSPVFVSRNDRQQEQCPPRKNGSSDGSLDRNVNPFSIHSPRRVPRGMTGAKVGI